jgi:predicted aspartyl protease
MKTNAPNGLLPRRIIVAFIFSAVLAFLSRVAAADIPMVDEGLMLRVPATMFNESHFFVVDSGSSTTVLNDTLLTRLGSPIGQVMADTPYHPDLRTNFYTAPDIFIGNTPLQLKKIVCIDLHMAQMISGEPCSGVLGMDVLSNYVVTMDFERNLFLLGQKPESANNSDSISVHLVSIGENRFGITTVLNGNHHFTLMIDSGSSVSVSLNKRDWDELFGVNAETVGRMSYFTGAGNIVQKSRIARLDSLRVGSAVYTNLLCTQLSNPNSVSHLGLGFLRQNSVILDFPSGQLHLFKRPNPPAEEDDMSGLHLLWQDGAVVIYAVDVGSPAQAAGLKAGDQIVSINGRLSSEFKMEQIRHLFEAGDGKQVETTVKREGKEFSTRVTLKRFI